MSRCFQPIAIQQFQVGYRPLNEQMNDHLMEHRAKCIKCVYCGLFFSPNKFIFHSHRLPDSKYVQPDAANFNSWRRHIKLSGTPPDDISFAWEDVKAMFNGGSRKRAMAASLNSVSKQQQQRQQSANQAEARNSLGAVAASSASYPSSGHKKAKVSSSSSSSPETGAFIVDSSRRSPDSPKSSQLNSPSHALHPSYPFPVTPMASKSLGLASSHSMMNSSNLMGACLPGSPNSLSGHQRPTLKGPPTASRDFRQSFAEFMWSGKQSSLPQLPYSCLLWPRPPTGVPGLLSWPGLVGPSEGSKGSPLMPPSSGASLRHKLTGSPSFFDPTIPENIMFAAAAAAAQHSQSLHSSAVSSCKEFSDKTASSSSSSSHHPHPSHSLLWDREIFEKGTTFYNHQNAESNVVSSRQNDHPSSTHASAFKPVSKKANHSPSPPISHFSGGSADTNHRVTSSRHSTARSVSSSPSSFRSDEVDIIGEEEVTASDESVKNKEERSSRDHPQKISDNHHQQETRGSSGSSSRSSSCHDTSSSPLKDSDLIPDHRITASAPLTYARESGGLDLSYPASGRPHQIVMRW